MKPTKRKAANLAQTTEKLSATIVSLVIVLLAGILARPWASELIVQAKNTSAQRNTNSQELTNATLTSAQNNEIPNSSFTASTANGIHFSAGNYRLNKSGQLMIDFCFDQVDTDDWTIWSSQVVDRQGLSATPSEGNLLEIRFPAVLIDGRLQQQITDFRGESSNDVKNYYIDADAGQKIGQRCVDMSYHLPPKFDLSSFTATVDNIVAYPDENAECSEAMPLKLQKVLDEKQTGIKIKLKIDKTDGGGMCGWEIVQKPENMSVDEAMSLLGSNEMLIDLYGVRGPWVFEGGIK